jgi:hypothetical protein
MPINPRSKNLAFLEGFTNVKFENGSAININFTNNSYADVQVSLIWKQAKGILENGKFTVYGPKDPIPEGQPINRTVQFTEVLHEINFFKDGFDNLYKEIIKSDVKGMFNMKTANEILIKSLISSSLSRTIKNGKRTPAWLKNKCWRIS